MKKRFSRRTMGIGAIALLRLGHIASIRSQQSMAADEELWDTAHQRGMKASEWGDIEASLALHELSMAGMVTT